MKGLERLMAGDSVTSIAADLGYKQPNPFIRLFRDTLGTTPRAWLSGLKRLERTAPPTSRA
jgi:AraC-like DNA-binding protein